MNGDTAGENELDLFGLRFPLPYRVAFMVVFAVWGWGMNLHYLNKVNIDVPSLVRYDDRSRPSSVAHHHSTYRLATCLTLTSTCSLVLFGIWTRHEPKLVVAHDWPPMVNLAVLAVLFVAPLRRFSISHTGRGRVLRILRRISIGGIAETKDGKFGDILLADALTSYAKVLADLYVCFCMFLTRGSWRSATARPDRACGGVVIVPLVMALPSAIRLRQCLIELGRARALGDRRAAATNFGNAAKYATAFPPVLFSSLQRKLAVAGETGAAAALFRAWLVAVLINSLYGFYWDVAKDWDLTLFSGRRQRNSIEHPFGLRRRMLIHKNPGVYYAAIAGDLVLRCTWLMKLSADLDRISDLESCMFVMQFLELVRRWVWIFFRVETEWIRNTSAGLGPDDILLADFRATAKLVDDE